MTTIDDLFPSNYLKAADVAHEPIVTISKVDREKMKSKEGKEELKPVIYFKEFEKGVVLNRTNATIIETLYGRDIDEWINARVQLYAPIVESFGERKPAIRIKEQKPAADKSQIIARYQKLWERGKKANMEGIENYVITPDMPTDEIIQLGKELKEKVEAAESF